MQSLLKMQAGFAAALFNSGAGSAAPGIRADGISPATRLGFYRTNVFENYREALSVTFSAIAKVVGRGFFGVLADEYIRRYPSRSGDVGQHGDQFPEFLRGHRCSRQLPYLADLARLEWCIDESFNETDAAPLDLQRLATVPEEHCEQLRFQLAPSCRLVSSMYPINRIWDLCQPDHDGEVSVDLDEGGVDLLIQRQGFTVVVEALGPGEFAMLMALSSGYDFATGYRFARGADHSFDPAAFLSKRVPAGVLVDFALPAETHAP